MKMTIHERLRRPLLACAVAAASAAACGTAGAASLDEEKLRLLSCDPGTSDAQRQRATQWLMQSAQALPRDAGQRLAGPVQLGKACLANVTVAAAFGAIVVQGEICNDSLDEFTDALGAVGIRLDPDVAPKMPGTVLGRTSGEDRYAITRGMLDMRTGKTVPASTPYAFMCTARLGGPQ